jgi:predicted ArsR family transcriptional regulator
VTGTRWSAVAALVDPVRRALYEYVRRQDHPVTREEAADAVAISRNLTAFHLDKLIDSGLLRARYEAPADRQRGRGRTPKVYEPVPGELSVSVPPRRYDLVAEVLADAVAEHPANARHAAGQNAYEHGRRIGAAAAPAPGTDGAAQLEAVSALLAELGFEPHQGAAVTLGNCPFRALAQRHPELVCGLNRDFLHGLLAGMGTDCLQARLRPGLAACCVEIAPAESSNS